MGTQMITVITSMNQRYHDLIGRDCVESWAQHWPAHLDLTVYVEEFELAARPRVNQIGFDQLEPDYAAFQQDTGTNTSEKKFAKKAYCFMHAMHTVKQGWILWIDADVISIDRQPEHLWEDLLSPRAAAMYMGVTYSTDKQSREGSWLVPETGVFAVNVEHPDFEDFRSEYCRRYRQRDRTGLRRFYDNDVFGVALARIRSVDHTDLCAGFAKPYKTPLPHTMLGPYLIHYKAKHSKAEYRQPTDDQ